MKTIHKFQIDVVGAQTVFMPDGAEILAVQVQRNRPCIWALVDPAAPIIEYTIFTHGTGHTVNENAGRYIGTYQLDGGAFIAHVFKGRA